jgi:hypothetical protein
VTLLQDGGVVFAVLGMLLAMLSMAAILKRYQAHQALVSASVRRLEVHAQRISAALAALSGVPLSRELRIILHTDKAACYRKIRGLYRRYPGIDGKIDGAQRAANAQGAPASGGVGPIENDRALRQIIGALDDLTAMLVGGGTLQTLAPDVRAIFRRELAERRAEAFARYHLVQARHFEKAADWARARSHLTRLMNELRNAAPSTEFVRGLYTEAQATFVALGSGRSRVAADTAEPPAVLADTA